jgi:cathepsin C
MAPRVCFALVAVFVTQVAADLPVHCLHEHVKGTWLFEMGDQVHSKDNIKCSDGVEGYADKNANFGLGAPNFTPSKKMHITLTAPNGAVAHDEDGKVHQGTWTMIYDEGFEVRVKGQKFFAYNKYKKFADHDESYCDKTFPGWYHSSELVDSSDWGCYTASKLTPVAPQKFRKFGSHASGSDNILLGLDAAYAPGADEDALIERVNAHPHATWKARRYKSFERPHRAAIGNLIQHYEEYKRPEGFVQEDVDVSDVPQDFDWNNVKGHSFVDPVINQGDCGSCYSVSTADMISARGRVLSKNSDGAHYRASPQSVLSQCGFYAQGCQGGFPYLASKYAQDFGATGWNKEPYHAADSQGQCPAKSQLVSRVKDYKYVGGYYGAASEANMRRELFDHGPLVVGIEVAPSMQMYDSGVYDTNLKLPNEDHFERVNHAVLVTGFGELQGKKYWNVKNSWGQFWGDNGYIKVARGHNTMNIEHMAVAAYPALSKDLPVSGNVAQFQEGQSMGHHMLEALSSKFQEEQSKDKFVSAISSGDEAKIQDPAFKRIAEANKKPSAVDPFEASAAKYNAGLDAGARAQEKHMFETNMKLSAKMNKIAAEIKSINADSLVQETDAAHQFVEN